MQFRHWLSVSASTFAGGALGWLATHLGGAVPTTGQGWGAVAAGASLAGAVALGHLFQDASPKAAPGASQAPAEAVPAVTASADKPS